MLIRLLLRLHCLFWLLLLSSCAAVPTTPSVAPQAYLVEHGEDQLLARYAPLFIVEEPQEPLNRIGRPTARINEDAEVEISIDPDQPAIYVMRQEFVTANGSYTNLIYRIHFERVPSHRLTGGNNVGLIIIITLNAQEEPVLGITDHTCGCYLSFTATQHTPTQALPADFSVDQRQQIYGESLPGRLELAPDSRLLIRLRPATHRVMELSTTKLTAATGDLQLVPTPLLPMIELERLPLGDTTTSFFDMEGRRQGYVRGSHKPWERLLMSWWAFDWRVGEDKQFRPPDGCGAVFYTSLKFWARKESDLCDFPTFLTYWGWKL